MEFGLPIGTMICCLSLVGIMLELWFAGIFWFAVGLIFIIDRFNDWKIIKGGHKINEL